MQRTSAIRYTYADYLSIPEDTSHRHEIVGGELFVTPAPRARHQEVVVNLTRVLANLAWERGHGKVFTGPITVHLHDELVVEPDVIFVRADRLGIVDPEGGVEGPPDLWIVDADESTVEVWTPRSAEPELLRDTLEWHVGERGFEISLAEVFRS